ncbi:MAG: UDP-3-O-(3-hydroxymyristoyl)glucosamine N-acyltransferase [Candidatus Omnitrophica bacterium]|nr:UDP-3-O-(3-hydroxymyristoyl)glucosamine N-acyltransferase [Candidatus Omnitrophota bacterium]
MHKTLQEIARLIDGEVVGDSSLVITGVSGIKEAHAGDITFLANPKYAPLLEKTLASAIITSKEITHCPKPSIRTENPSLAFAKLLSQLMPADVRHPQGIHPSAVIGKRVTLGKNVSCGPYVVINDDAVIGDNTIVYAHAFIGNNVRIGGETLIYANVAIREHVTIGDRVIIHSGTVIGSDGFGYVTVEGKHHKIPQVGQVIIEDDVEIGANCAIDRARFEKTVIGKGTKIDNLVHIAHNVIIGEHCLIVAQVGVSGSTTLGNNVILAGQVGLVGHISVGDNAVVMAQAGVNKSIPADAVYWGYPAKPVETARKVNACVQNLPKLYDHVGELRKKVEELTKHLKES